MVAGEGFGEGEGAGAAVGAEEEDAHFWGSLLSCLVFFFVQVFG